MPADPNPEDGRDALKKSVDAYSGLASLVYKVAAAGGAVITLLYLFSIDFFPQGLTPGEVIFFVFVALAFGFLYFVLLLYGAYSSIWLTLTLTWVIRGAARFRQKPLPVAKWQLARDKIKGRRNPDSWLRRMVGKRRDAFRGFRRLMTRAHLKKLSILPKDLRGWLISVTSFVVFALMAAIALEQRFVPLYELLIGYLLGGFIFLCLLPNDYKATSRYTGLHVGLAVSIPLFVVVIFAKPTPLLHLVFQGLGIRALNVSLEVPEAEAAIMERVSEVMGRPLVDCRRTSAGKLLVHNADVLWNGVGTQILVAFTVRNPKERGLFERDNPPLRQATLRLDAGQIQLLKTTPPIDPCFDLPTDMLFHTAKYELTEEAQQRIDEVVAAIRVSGVPGEISVRGHSDPRPVSLGLTRSIGDNQRLSEMRAKTVAETLQRKFDAEKPRIRPEGMGSREPKVKCLSAVASSKYESEQCNGLNRRVEIRVKLRSGGNGQGSGGTSAPANPSST